MITEPKLIICDEPVSALDVSVQAQILNLLEDIKARYGLTLIFIAHDLTVVKNVSDRVIVMYLGKICEIGTPGRDLPDARPPSVHGRIARGDPGARIPTFAPMSARRSGGEIPSPVAPPSGCRFTAHGARRHRDKSAQEEPVVAEHRPGHFVACHFPLQPGETLPTRNGRSSGIPG